MPTLAILGSGLAGLSAATTIQANSHAQGLTVIVLDKGQNPGGRMASYSPEPGQGWDYGAQFAKADNPAFFQWVNNFTPQTTPWPDPERFVIPGGFRQLAERAALGLNTQQRCTVNHITWDDNSDRWKLSVTHATAGPKTFWADGLMLTCPVPQALKLIAPYLPTDHDLDQITYAPNMTWQVMANQPLPTPYRNDTGMIGWACDNAAKWPDAGHCWTVQSTPAYANAHFDVPEEALNTELTAALPVVTGLPNLTFTIKRLHRWRYALVTNAYHLPYYAHPTRPLWLAGDGFCGPRLEAAWTSGHSVAKAMLATYLDPSRH